MARKRFYVCAVLLLGAICLSPRPGHCQTTITFVSDPTWNTFELNPDGTQGGSLGHDQCSTWSGYPLQIPGACWIWKPGVDASSPADLQGAYFTKQFNLAGVPTAGQVLVAVDDFAELIVNGSSVGSTGSVTDFNAALAAQGHLVAFDVLPYLVTGINTVTIKAQNGPAAFAGGQCNPCAYSGNGAGLVFSGSLAFAAPTPVMHATWTDLKARYH